MVLDLATFVAAPFCCTLLGEFDAGVIKVEQPGKGDGLRLEVDGDGHPRALVELTAEVGDARRGEDHGEDPVLEAVLEEDAAETRLRPGEASNSG
jgi:hypothetical protein